MDKACSQPDDITVYEAPRVLASFAAEEILAQAETGSVVIIVS
jgi:hypothetical protein